MTDTTPAPSPAISQFLKAHERLIIVILAAVLLAGFYTKAIAYLASRDQNAANAAQAVLQAQVTANEKEATDAKQMLQQYEQLTSQLIANNNAILLGQKQLAAVTQKHQTADQTLPPPQLAARWTNLLQVAPTTVQPSGQGYVVTPDTAVKTVTQLETIPELQSDLAGDQTIISNNQKQIGEQSNVVTTLQGQIVGLNIQIADQTKFCSDQITAVKAQARKSKLKWFIGGFVAGFVSRELIKP